MERIRGLGWAGQLPKNFLQIFHIAYTPYTTRNSTVYCVTGKNAVWKNYNGSNKSNLLSC